MKKKDEETRLGERELDIMNALWELGTASVAEVRERLSDDVAYNTVQTMLNRLETKGHVTRELHGRAYRYRPQLRQPSVAGKAVRSVIDRFFSGSAEALAAHLVSRGLSKGELDRVRKLIDDQRVKEKE